MIVFNKYFKIVKQHLGTIIMFTAICVIVTIINTNYNTQDSFKSVENNIAIINHDDSKIIDNYIKYIDKGSNIIDTKDDKQSSRYDSTYQTAYLRHLANPTKTFQRNDCSKPIDYKHHDKGVDFVIGQCHVLCWIHADEGKRNSAEG